MHKPLRFNDYSSRKFFGSILLGLATMVIFYLFQQYLFVLYRSVLLAFKFNANHLLSEDIGNLVAFVFAGNAVILGNSVGIAFYISGVSKNIKSRSRKRNVLNNQSFLIGSHFFLFIKAEIFIGVVLLSFFNLAVQDLIWSIFILLFIVLFLESVKELRRSFKGYTVKMLLFHFLLIAGLLFACTLFNKSSYYKTGIIYNTSNPYVAIPKTIDTVSYDNQVLRSKYSYNSCRIPVKILHDSKNISYRLSDHEIYMTELVNGPYECIYQSRYDRDPELMVYADATIKYNRLKELERDATLRGMYVINYVIYAVNEENEFMYPKVLYRTKAIYENAEKSIIAPPPDIPPPPEFVYFEEYLQDKKEQALDLDDFILKSKVDKQKVYTYFQKSVSDSVFFTLNIHNEVTLQQYLDFMISYKQSVYDLRDEQRVMNKALHISEEYMVRKKFPFFLLEEIE